MSSSGSNVPLTMQRHTRAQEGLALVWRPVPGAIRYGFVVGFADMPVPPIEAIMRGAAPGFAVLGIPPRFTGAVDLGSPVGEERQYALIAYRGDGAMAPVAGVQFLPARSAPRDREYHPLIPPALTRPPGWTPPVPAQEATTTAPVDTAPARREQLADPWAALESASGAAGGAPASSPATPVSPSSSAEAPPAQRADPWAALDAAAREQQAPPAERSTPSVSFAAPQAAVQPPVSPPNTPAGRPIERAPEQQPEPPRGRQAEPAKQDVTPRQAERPAASLREQAPAASQAETPVAPEQQGERKAGRWGVFQALRQKIVTPIIPPPAREDQSQAPVSPPAHSQAEARTPDEASPSIAPAASISPAAPSSTTPSMPPASEPVEAIIEQQREQAEAISEVQARTDLATPVERAAPPEAVEERPTYEEREETVPEQTARQAAEAITPAEERPDEQIILPEPVAFMEQPPTAAEEPSDDWIAQAEAELAAQWAARNVQEEERPDVSAEAVSDVQEGVAPDVVAEVAPDVPKSLAPGVAEGAALATLAGATPDAMAMEEQAAVIVPGEEEQAAVSGSLAVAGPDQALVAEVQIAEPVVRPTEPDAPSAPAAVADEGIVSTAGENIVPAGEISTSISPESAPIQAQSIDALAAEAGAPVISETIDTGGTAEMPTAIDVPAEEEEIAPAAEHGAPDLAVENPSDAAATAGAAATIDAEMPQPAEEAATLGEEHEDVEPPYVAPVEAQASVTPTGSEAPTAPTGSEVPTPPVEVDAMGVPIGAEASATPVNAEALVAPEAESLTEEAELATAETPGDVPAAPALAGTTTAEAAIEYGHGKSDAGSGDDEGAQSAPPVAAEPEFAAGSSALDEADEMVAAEADEAVAPSGHETPIVAGANRIPIAAGIDETTLNATPANGATSAGAMEGAPTTAYAEPAGAVDPSLSEVRVEQPERHGEVGNAPESGHAVLEAAPDDALAGQAEPPIDAPQMDQAEQETPLSASALPEELPGEPVGDPREEHPVGAVTPVLEEPVAVDAAAESTAMAMPEAMAAPKVEPASGIATGEETAPALETTPPPVLDVEPSHADEEPDHEAVAAEAPLEASTVEGDQPEQITVVESAGTMPAPEPIPVASWEPIPVASVEPTPPAPLAESAAEPSIQAEETAGEQAKEIATAVAPGESGALPEVTEPIGSAEPTEAITLAAPSWDDSSPEAARTESMPVEAEPPATETVSAEPELPVVPAEAEPSAAVAMSAEESRPALDVEPAAPSVAAEFAPTLSAASIEPEPVVEPEVVPELTVTPESISEPEVMPEPVAEQEAEQEVEMPAASIPAVEIPATDVVPEPDPALAGPPPSPSEAVAMLDEAELYLLPTWLDLAAAARLLAQAARAIPGDPRLLDLQRQLHDAQAADDGESVEDLLGEARAALERRDYWGAVDSYEQALTRQGDNAEARQGLERARVLARWSAQMSGAGSDAGRLQHIGDDFMDAAPDLAAQSYAAAFAAHPTIVILRGLLLSQAHSEQWDGLVASAAHGVETLRQSGRIAADPASDAAVALLRQQVQASIALGGVQGAIENLIQTLVASAQQGRH